MKKALLTLFLLACGHSLLAQSPPSSFAVTSACPGRADNPSVLQKVNTDGSLTPVDTIKDGTTPLTINGLGADSNPTNQAVVYGMRVVLPPPGTLNPFNLNPPPTDLYRIDLSSAQATKIGTVPPPPTPTSGLSPALPGEFPLNIRQTFNFIGDGGSNSNYYIAGATARVFVRLSDTTFRVRDMRLYVGMIRLPPASTPSPVWRPLNTSNGSTIVANYQRALEDTLNAYRRIILTNPASVPVPQGGIQDWVYDVRTGNLVSYIGKEDKFLTISNPSNPATNPVGSTRDVNSPIPGQQDIGSMFTDRDGNLYAVQANSGTIYKIDPTNGNYTGSSYGSAFGCSRGDAVSLPGALPLPVTLTRFSATLVGGSVRLSWATAREENAESFLVQRRHNGTEWQTVQTVRASNRAQGQTYSAVDAAPLDGQSYYRLVVRDLDGSMAYSPVQSVTLTSKVVQTYPNPSDGHFTVRLPQAMAAGTTLELLTTTGTLARRFQPAAGLSILSLDAHDLPGGLYYLRVQQPGSVNTVPVMLAPGGAR